MFDVLYQQDDGKRLRYFCEQGDCIIGSGSSNHIVLQNKRIAKAHARICFDKTGCRVEDLGSNTGTWVNQERVVTYGPLSQIDEIVIGDTRLWVVARNHVPAAHATSSSIPPNKIGERHQANQQTKPAEAKIASLPDIDSHVDPARSERAAEMIHWRQFIHDKLIEQMDLRRKDVHSMSDEQLRVETDSLIKEIIRKQESTIPIHIDRPTLHNDVLNEAVGLGPLEALLAEDAVTEIMVNRSDEIFVERKGQLELSECTFTNDQAVLGVIERIITPIGRRIDESMPMVDARLKDGSRVNAIIPPLAIKGPSITIRKFSKKRLQVDDLVNFNSISQPMVDFLRICVEQRRNVVISGGTGSGKTTLLNVLSNLIPDDERIVTVEDAAELQLNQPNMVSLESRPPNLEGKGAISIRDLVRNSLRMRPDRIVVGECRGGEALDMLQAMNTGHDGSLTTLHANSPRDALSRMEVLVLMAGMDLPITAIREQIASAVNIIVQQTRFACGSRKVTYITEVTGIEGGKIQLQDIFVYNQMGVDANKKVTGEFVSCNFVPSFYEELGRIGLELDLSIFREQRGAQA
jgi:pilus assembly protein CpaF